VDKKLSLVVDDAKNIRLTFSETLAQIGFDTQTAANGEEALSKMAIDPSRPEAFNLLGAIKGEQSLNLSNAATSGIPQPVRGRPLWRASRTSRKSTRR